MEGKSGSGSDPRNDDHQSAAVNVSERKFGEDKRRVCSSAECKTFLGEADRNRKTKDSRNSEKSDLLKPQTTENHLQESYNNAFQKHVDNLTNVISQHRQGRQPDKPKTEVHIHPTEISKNTRNATPKPLSKLEIKNEAGVNQKITFAQEEDEEEEFEDFNKMKPLKAVKKVDVLREGLEDETFFEELEEAKPMITFNHVCTEAESDQISFNQIKSSRSSSPMLEVPSSKSLFFPEMCEYVERVKMSSSLDAEEISNQLVNERKLYRERLYSGIFEKHRQTLFVLGAFLKLFKTTAARRKEYEAK